MKQRHISTWGLLGLATLLLVLLGIATPGTLKRAEDHRRQHRLQPFYETPAGFAAAKPGAILKRQRMAIKVPFGGTAERILYRSERLDGTPTVSSGIVFTPAGTRTNRPVVAWAHGTIGFGDACAPSRSATPLANLRWLGGMLQRGWVVTATDYAGLGTAGTSRYLIGRDEASDVLNSVRAARNLDPRAGNRFALWGHSQGGHAALWSAREAARYAPELDLVATAAGAPAAELVPLFTEQEGSTVSWVIGPDVTAAWPSVYPGLNVDGVVSRRGRADADMISRQCAVQSGIGAIIRHAFNQRFFKQDPMADPSWRKAAERQTPVPLAPAQPLLVAQSLSDQVVLPDTTARLAKAWCASGSNLTTLWIDQVTHQQTAVVTGPAVTEWLGDRFAGKPTHPTCGQPLPVKPAV
jgi:alpha-beta hydrolase superfamily lysophospholipase